jgi:hypothetical protein
VGEARRCGRIDAGRYNAARRSLSADAAATTAAVAKVEGAGVKPMQQLRRFVGPPDVDIAGAQDTPPRSPAKGCATERGGAWVT